MSCSGAAGKRCGEGRGGAEDNRERKRGAAELCEGTPGTTLDSVRPWQEPATRTPGLIEAGNGLDAAEVVFRRICSSGAWAFSSGKPKPIRTQGTLKVSCIWVTKGWNRLRGMNTAFLPKPFCRAPGQPEKSARDRRHPGFAGAEDLELGNVTVLGRSLRMWARRAWRSSWDFGRERAVENLA